MAEVRALARLALVLLIAATATAFAQSGRETRVVHVAAVSDAIAPATLDHFSRETGIRLTFDSFETPEAVETAVARGTYDVAVVSGPALERLREAGKLAPLDPTASPALAMIDPTLTRLAPGGSPLAYSAWGVAFDAKRARERLGDRQIESWETALRPDIWKAFSDCGAALPDDPAAMLAAAALALKIDPQSRRAGDLRRSLDRLTAARAGAKSVASTGAITADLAAGEICLALLTSADAAQAAARARAAGEETDILFVLPREGAPVRLDALAILRAGAHPAEAAAFVDFALRPESVARATARSRYSNAVPASRDILGADASSEPTLFPDAATLAKLFVPAPMDAPTQAQVARDWARLKTGK